MKQKRWIISFSVIIICATFWVILTKPIREKSADDTDLSKVEYSSEFREVAYELAELQQISRTLANEIINAWREASNRYNGEYSENFIRIEVRIHFVKSADKLREIAERITLAEAKIKELSNTGKDPRRATDRLLQYAIAIKSFVVNLIQTNPDRSLIYHETAFAGKYLEISKARARLNFMLSD